MTIEEEVAKAEDLINWLDSTFRGVEMPGEKRNLMAGACLDMAHEHHRAIILLFKSNIFGTGFAVLRLMYESYVRGLWLHKCATSKDVDRYGDDNFNYRFDSLVKDIEKQPEFDSRIISLIKDNTWSIMNSMTHTGFQQVGRRYNSTSIGPNYDPEEVIRTIRFSSLVSIMVALAIADLCNNEALLKTVIEKQQVLIAKGDSNVRHKDI